MVDERVAYLVKDYLPLGHAMEPAPSWAGFLPMDTTALAVRKMEQIDARELTSDLLPKLKATQHLIDNTLKMRIEKCEDGVERQRLTQLKQEFELEMMMIRMNLEHLLKRYSEQLQAAAEGREQFKSPLLALDDSESVAIESARRLYRRAQELQTR